MALRRGWILLVLLFLGGCVPTPLEVAAPETVPAQTTTDFPADDLGRAIALQQPAQRVVSIGPGATETIFALGAGEQLVGRDQSSDYPAAALKVPVAGDFTGPFPEKVVALRPDLVIVQGETYDAARAQLWEDKIGAPVAVLVPTSLERVAQGIEKMGAWLGASSKANELAEPLLNSGEKSAALGTAFFEVSRSPLWAAGGGTLVDDVMQRAGLKNAAQAVQGYKQYSLETLATQKLDFYILSQDNPQPAAAIQALKAQPVLGKLPAVRAGRVLVLDSDLVLRPGPRLAEGIRVLRAQAEKLQAETKTSRN